jgi:threonine/homoserine/homoserine lactone efflux protein
MIDLGPIFTAWLVGLVSGFLVSIPVGPINVTIINDGSRKGFLWAILIGFGAVVMEAIYCTIGFAGFTTFFDTKAVKASMQLISFLLMLFLGLKYLVIPTVPATSKSIEKVEEKFHPHSAFMIGFVRVLGNPSVLLFWVALAATFMSHEWVEDHWVTKGACVVGVTLGAALWFALLSYLVSRSHWKFSTRTLLRMEHISGACLLLVAVVLGVRIIMLLARKG